MDRSELTVGHSVDRWQWHANEMKFSHLSCFILICIVGRYQAQRPSGVQNVLNIFRQVFRRPSSGSSGSALNDNQQSVSVSTVFAFPEGAYPISTAVQTVNFIAISFNLFFKIVYLISLNLNRFMEIFQLRLSTLL